MARLPWKSLGTLKGIVRELRGVAGLWQTAAAFRDERQALTGEVAEILTAIVQLRGESKRRAVSAMAKIARHELTESLVPSFESRPETAIALREMMAAHLKRLAKTKLTPQAIAEELAGTFLRFLRYRWFSLERSKLPADTSWEPWRPRKHLRDRKVPGPVLAAFLEYMDNTAPGERDAKAITVLGLRAVGLPNARAVFNFETTAKTRRAERRASLAKK